MLALTGAYAALKAGPTLQLAGRPSWALDQVIRVAHSLKCVGRRRARDVQDALGAIPAADLWAWLTLGPRDVWCVSDEAVTQLVHLHFNCVGGDPGGCIGRCLRHIGRLLTG